MVETQYVKYCNFCDYLLQDIIDFTEFGSHSLFMKVDVLKGKGLFAVRYSNDVAYMKGDLYMPEKEAVLYVPLDCYGNVDKLEKFISDFRKNHNKN